MVILDLDMPGGDPLEAMRRMAQEQPSVRTIVYTGHVRNKLIDQAFGAGAWGYVAKHEDTETIVDAIRRVASGEVVIAPGEE